MGTEKRIVRYELTCGQLTPEADKAERALYHERHQEHDHAKGIADKLGMNSHFEESLQRGTWHLDGYVYAPLSKAVQVLQALKDANVEVDIADVPSEEHDLIKKIEALEWVSRIEPFTK